MLSVKDFRGRHDWRPKLDYAVFDSVSLATTFRAELAKHRIIICAISEAIREYPAVLVPVDDPAVLDDLNTPEDYERLVRDINRDIY